MVTKYGDHDYCAHVMMVFAEVRRYTSDPNIIAAAILHDVVEDCNVSHNDIIDAFGDDIANMVYLVTDPVGKNRKERKEQLYFNFENEPSEYLRLGAAIIKCCDRLVNHQFSIDSNNHKKMAMYLGEIDKFVHVFGDTLLGYEEYRVIVAELLAQKKLMAELLENGKM